MPKENQFSAFEFHPKDFISSADVQTMSAEEIGCYILLLAYSWLQENQCFLTKDEKFLRKLCKISQHKWKKVQFNVLKKFTTTPDGGHIYNKRLLIEYNKQVNAKRIQVEAGKKGAKKRWGAFEEENGVPTVSPLGSDSSSLKSNNIINNIINNNINTKRSNKYYRIYGLLAFKNRETHIGTGVALLGEEKLHDILVKTHNETMAKISWETYCDILEKERAKKKKPNVENEADRIERMMQESRERAKEE